MSWRRAPSSPRDPPTSSSPTSVSFLHTWAPLRDRPPPPTRRLHDYISDTLRRRSHAVSDHDRGQLSTTRVADRPCKARRTLSSSGESEGTLAGSGVVPPGSLGGRHPRRDSSARRGGAGHHLRR